MFEKISDLFKEVKNRLSNPLIASFIISWLLTNWRVPVGLIMYSNKELHSDWYGGYFQLIYNEASWWAFLFQPLCLAILYTFLFPLINTGILAFQAKIRVWSDNMNMEIMKDYYVPMSRFVKQKNEYDTLAKELRKIYDEDKQTVVDNERLTAEALQMNDKLSALNSQLSEKITELSTIKETESQTTNELKSINERLQKYRVMNDIKQLEGFWDFTVTHKNRLVGNIITPNIYDTNHLIQIKENEIHLIHSDTSTSIWANIVAFSWNYNDKLVYLTFFKSDDEHDDVNTTQRKHLVHQTLTVSNHMNGSIYEMSGLDSDGNEVRYRLSDIEADSELL